MSKYKIGDKVKVREDLVGGKIYEGQSTVSDMVEFKGKEVTIETVRRTSCSGNDEYRIKELGFTWTNEMFEEIIKPDFKYGDRVELTKIDTLDKQYGLEVGNTGVVVSDSSKYGYCRVSFPRHTKDLVIYNNQIKLVQPKVAEETSESMAIPNKGTIKYRITDDGIAYVTLNGHNSGKSIKSPKDESRNEVGILISVARSLGFDEDKISGIVDVLFDDDSYNSKAKCDNAIMKNDIARALSILDKYKEV